MKGILIGEKEYKKLYGDAFSLPDELAKESSADTEKETKRECSSCQLDLFAVGAKS